MGGLLCCKQGRGTRVGTLETTPVSNGTIESTTESSPNELKTVFVSKDPASTEDLGSATVVNKSTATDQGSNAVVAGSTKSDTINADSQDSGPAVVDGMAENSDKAVDSTSDEALKSEELVNGHGQESSVVTRNKPDDQENGSVVLHAIASDPEQEFKTVSDSPNELKADSVLQDSSEFTRPSNQSAEVPGVSSEESVNAQDPQEPSVVNKSESAETDKANPDEAVVDVSVRALNEECNAVLDRLVPKKSEEDIRKKVASLLNAWDESGKLAKLEENVENIPVSSAGTISDLAQALKEGDSYDMNSSLSQITLAYKVYCWVTKNVHYNERARGNVDPNTVLVTKQAVCHGYTTLFQAIAKEVGLTVSRVAGGKTRTVLNPSWSFDDSDSHTWNVVC